MDARSSHLLLPLSLVVALFAPPTTSIAVEQTCKAAMGTDIYAMRNQRWHLPGTPNSYKVLPSNRFILVCKGMAVRREKPWHSFIGEELKTTVSILEAHDLCYLLGMSKRRNSSTGNELE